jgi:SAM-dependent methyltransferase
VARADAAQSAACIACGAATRRRFAVGGHPLHVCPRCGLEFLHPQPDDAELARIYGRHYYDAWGQDDDGAAARALKMATFRRRIAAAHLAPAARILDVGAGTGYFLEAARESGLDAYAVELSDYGAARCAAIVGAGRVHHGQLDDARFADFAPGLFDAVFMSDLLEHVRDPHATLAAAARRLAAHGVLVITTPWTGSLSHRLSGRRWLHYKPEHLFYFGAGNLPRLLARHGFEGAPPAPALKSLSLAYAKSQFAAGGGTHRIAAGLLGLLPRRLLDRPLWLRIGEATLTARLSRSAAP